MCHHCSLCFISSRAPFRGKQVFWKRTCTGLNVGRRGWWVSAGTTPRIVGSGQENTMRDQEKACWQVGRQAGRRAGWDASPITPSGAGGSTAVVVWCECEVNDVSLPYSQPVWTACHWWSGHTALPGWPAYGSAHPWASSAWPCGPTWACSPAGGCAAPCTGGFGSCRCPGTDALFAAPWTGGVRREMKQLGKSTSCFLGTDTVMGRARQKQCRSVQAVY